MDDLVFLLNLSFRLSFFLPKFCLKQ